MNSKIFVMAAPAIFIGVISTPAFSQAEKVMRGGEITESALIDALTPAPSTSGTRSIRPMRENGPRTTPISPVKTARTSLLITFETNSADLTSQAKQSLDVLGEALNSSKLAEFNFAVEGHADPRGTSGANLELSRQRAEAVRRYLVQHKGIEDRRLEAIGKGDRELINAANPYAPENRRVTIVNRSQ